MRNFWGTSGVTFGAAFFSLCVKVLAELICLNVLLLADDMKLYRRISSTHDMVALQNNVNVVFEWCQVNNMTLNIDESVVSKDLVDYGIRHSFITV